MEISAQPPTLPPNRRLIEAYIRGYQMRRQINSGFFPALVAMTEIELAESTGQPVTAEQRIEIRKGLLHAATVSRATHAHAAIIVRPDQASQEDSGSRTSRRVVTVPSL
ncbi:MAG TPA: hypothetical protein VH144_03065 [Candidatus Saccharimonadales bacterium]|jgi:hypothetical protein|nr:hypothetical protein [Candidatus Saccharimonadales bacterium]